MSDQPTSPEQFEYLDEGTAEGKAEETYVAPDEPMGSHAFGITAAEVGEPFNLRDRHTNPEVFEATPYHPNDVGRLVQPGDEDVDAIDQESTTVAWGDGNDDGTLTAEEAAMHRTDSP